MTTGHGNAKPRAAVASSHGQRRGGYAARAVHGNGYGWGVQRTAPMARRREPGGPAAKHRALPQRYRTTGHEGAHDEGAHRQAEGCARQRARQRGGIPSRTSGARDGAATGAGGEEGRKNGGSVCRKMNC